MVRSSDDERDRSIRSGWQVEPEGTAGLADPGTSTGGTASADITASADVHIDAPDAVAEHRQQVQADANQMSSVMLVVLGLVGGIYLLFAWVWLTWAQFYGVSNELAAAGSGSIGGMLQQAVFWIAPLAPIFWFLAALVLQRGAPARLVTTLIVGLIVLFPLPMIWSQGVAFA